MSIPEGLPESTSLLANIAGKVASAASTVASAGKTCFNVTISAVTSVAKTAISGLSSVAGGTCVALKKGLAFTATVHAANPKSTKVGFVALAALGLYVSRSYYLPTVRSILHRLQK